MRTFPQTTTAKLSEVKPNPDQPRKHFDPIKLAELADSIRQNGLLQPITVTPRGGHYMIVAGERRYRACQLAGLDTIAAIVQAYDDATVARLALIENVQREDMNAIETAHGYQALIDSGTTEEEVGAMLGKRAQEVHFYCQLTRLAENVKEAVALGIIGTRVAWDIARLDDTNDQRLIFAKVAHGELTAAQVSSFVSAWIAAKDQTTMFGEPEAPQAQEARRRQAKSLKDKVDACVRTWATLADAIEAAGADASDLLAGDVAILKQLSREYGRLHGSISKTQRNRALVLEVGAAA